MSLDNFSTEIHPSDFMYNFLCEHAANDTSRAKEMYFGGGQHDARQVVSSATRFGFTSSRTSVLEFASGYGRVTRFLSDFSMNYMAADIHVDAVRFIRSHLDTNCMLSTAKPQEFVCRFRFDFIFVLSLFSHLPEEPFREWLSTLCGLLEPGGCLLFTTHGEAAVAKNDFLRKIYDPSAGFAFIESSEQKDLNGVEYGTTISNASFVIDAISKIPDCRLLSYTPDCWFGLQDEWVLSRC